jgi:hypothetical protein
VTEELRGLLREELSAERPPPLGDLVGTVLREGRRIRRRRRIAALGGGTALAGVTAVVLALGTPFGTTAAPPPSGGGPAAATADPPPVRAPSLLVATPASAPASLPPGLPRASPARTVRAVPATPEALLVLLHELLPPGRTSHYAKADDRALRVQLYLDRGAGPGMVRLSVSGTPSPDPTDGVPEVTVDGRPGDCLLSRIVRARWPGGLTVQANLSTCLAWNGRQDGPSPLALTDAEAVAVVTDPRWAAAVDPLLTKAAAEKFPHLALFG